MTAATTWRFCRRIWNGVEVGEALLTFSQLYHAWGGRKRSGGGREHFSFGAGFPEAS
jgi:hypothetical protein